MVKKAVKIKGIENVQTEKQGLFPERMTNKKWEAIQHKRERTRLTSFHEQKNINSTG